MIFNSAANYTVKNVFMQNWTEGQLRYLHSPRPRHGIVLILKGEISFISDKNTVTASHNDIVLLPENSYYKIVTQGAEDYLINFECDNIFINEPTKLLSNTAPKYTDIFAKIFDAKIKDSSDFLLKSLFYMLLDNIVSDMGNPAKKLNFVESAKEMLESEENFSINEIAKKCAASVSGFRSAFKSTYGISPMDYKIKIRINRAKTLLQSTSMTVAEISEKLGFYDAAYFCKIFKKHEGCSPINYKNKKSL